MVSNYEARARQKRVHWTNAGSAAGLCVLILFVLAKSCVPGITEEMGADKLANISVNNLCLSGNHPSLSAAMSMQIVALTSSIVFNGVLVFAWIRSRGWLFSPRNLKELNSYLMATLALILFVSAVVYAWGNFDLILVMLLAEVFYCVGVAIFYHFWKK